MPATDVVIISGGTLTNRSGSVATGGTAVTIAANSGRKYLRITNPISLTHQNIAAAESLWIDETGTAAVNGANSTELPPGATITFEGEYVHQGAVSINATTSGHRYVAKEG